MDSNTSQGVSRRDAIRLGAVGAALAGFAPIVGGHTASAASTRSMLRTATGLRAGSRPGGDLVIALNGQSDIKSFNQCLAYDGGSQFPSTLIFSRLTVMDYGPDFAIHPQLAESWEVSDDAREYVFHLVQNATWHDGEPVTANDVKVTYEGIIANGGPAAGLLANLETIQIHDDHTVRFVLSKPDASLLYSISVYPRTSILPAHLYEGTDWSTNEHNLEPVGSGPFVFDSLAAGQQLILAANLDYFGGAPLLDRVGFQFVSSEQTALAGLRSGQFGALAFPPSLSLVKGLQEEPGLAVEAPSGPWACYVGFNMTKDPMTDPAVRKAISLALDRGAINDRVTSGVAVTSTGPFVESTPWANNPDAAYPAVDKAAAVELLESAGYTANGDGVRLSLGLTVSSNDFYGDVAEVVKSELAEIGVEVTIELLDRATWLQAAANLEHDLIIDALWIGPDPNEWRSQVGTGGAYNRTGYSNPDVDALFDQGVSSSDQATRAEAYFAVAEIIADELPVTNIFAAPYSFVHRSEYEGFFSQDGTISYRLDVSQVRKVS